MPRGAKYPEELWQRVRAAYVQGVEDENGFRRFPTYQQLEAEYNVNYGTIALRCKKEGWQEERAIFERKLREDIDAKKRKELLKASVEFDSSSLKLAKAIQAEIGQLLVAAQYERQKIAQGLEPERKIFTSSALSSMAMALATAQKVGRLALGESTENGRDVGDFRAELDEARAIVARLAEQKRTGGNLSVVEMDRNRSTQPASA
jgi:hypothetical protein